MQTRSKIGHLSAVVTVGVAAAGSASATGVHIGSSTGSFYVGSTSGSSLANVQIAASSGLGTITCTSGSLGGQVVSPNPVIGGSVSTPFTAAGLSGCTTSGGTSCSASPSGLTWSGLTTYAAILSGRDATLDLAPQGVSVTCGATTCNYATTSSSSDVYNAGNPFAPLPTYGSSTQVAINASMAKQSGSGLSCASSASWIGIYGWTANVGPIVVAEL